jgi:hypothetical protein
MSKMRRRASLSVGIIVLAAGLVLPMSGTATAVDVPDQVLAWNQHAYDELIVTAAQAPPVAAIHLAMVHGAIYDAVNAIDGSYEPYLGAPSADGTESTDAAAAMITARTNDGRFGNQFFTEGTGPGDWRNLVSPLAPTGNNFKWVGVVKPFLVPDASAFATWGPLPLDSAAYAAEFRQVKSLGSASSTIRTADQTAMAHFWVDHAVAMWNRIFRQVSVNQELSVTENARYFAMLYTTGSDAIIACFQDKQRHAFWRPTTAIRLAGIDGNAATVADPDWTALIGVPPYPDHPSGHNCISSSFVETLKDFFGTNQMTFSATRATSPIGPITRNFTRFSQAINEVRLARMYGGIHFMTADAQGASLGKKVENYAQANYFQPV